MTRVEIEKQLLSLIGLVTSAGSIKSDAGVNLRAMAQTAIQAAVEDIASADLWACYRKPFGSFLKSSVTGTLNFTRGEFTAVVTGQTIDSTWYGGHVYCAVNGYPQNIVGVTTGTSTLTFAQPFAAATNTAAAFTMYFDGALVPTDCRRIDRNSMRLEGSKLLRYVSVPEMQSFFGYYSGATDYGFLSDENRQVIREPTVAQPTCYTIAHAPVISNANRWTISTYPFPDANYALGWQGYRLTTALTCDGAATGDAEVPDLPAEFHRSLLVPMAKLKVADWPGYELTGQQIDMLSKQAADGMRHFYSANHIDGNPAGPRKPPQGWV